MKVTDLQFKCSGVTAVGEADMWRSDQLREVSTVFPTRPGTSPALGAQNLLTTRKQKLQWLHYPEHSHSQSRYPPTSAFSSYLAYAEASCYTSDTYTCTPKSCDAKCTVSDCYTNEIQHETVTLQIWSFHTAAGAECSRWYFWHRLILFARATPENTMPALS